MAKRIIRRAGAVAQLGGPRDSQRGRTKRDKGNERPYARYREVVFLFSAVPANGGSLTGTSPKFPNDIDFTFKRGSARLTGGTATYSNAGWSIGYQYQAGDKISSAAQTNGSETAQAQAALGTDGIGGWIDPPLRFRANVILLVTVINHHTATTAEISVVFGVREWYFVSDPESGS